MDQLNALPKSRSLKEDGQLLHKQIVLLQRMLDILELSFLDITEIRMHTIKYSQKEIVLKVNDHIERTSRANNDHIGRLNYLLAFTDICESNLSYIDEMIQTDEVVTRAINGANPPTKAELRLLVWS